MALVVPSSVVNLARPAAGQQAVVAASPGVTLQLGFLPDDAATEASGSDLVFRFPDGSSIVVTGFFEGGADQLPALQLADGTELSGKDFLTAFNPDLLSTAAGPGAGAGAAGGGSGEYADDPGALVNGIDRLGSLGTIYWDRVTEVPEDRISEPAPTPLAALDPPDPALPLDPVPPVDPLDPDDPDDPVTPPAPPFTPGGALFADAAGFEDWRADQHIHGQNAPADPIRLAFTLDIGDAVVTGVDLTGFTPGTVLYIGDPAAGRTITVGADGAAHLTYEQLVDDGVYVLPPAHSDVDMNIHAEASMTLSDGSSHTVSGDFTIAVDAVADRPDDVTGDVSGIDNAAHSASGSSAVHERAEGFETDTVTVSAGPGEGRVPVQISVTATFYDMDDSETHFVLVEQLSGFTGPYPVTVVDGVGYFQIPVDNADIIAAGGRPVVTVDLLSPQVTADSSFAVRTGAMAVEAPSDAGEPRLDNNVSVVINETAHEFTVDVVDSALQVKVGWASEDGDAFKHGGEVSGFDAMEIDPLSTSDTRGAAPITFDLGDNNGSGEVITSVVITLSPEDAIRGQLEYSGEGVMHSVTGEDGTVTVTIDGVSAPSLAGLMFVPAGGDYGDVDVDLAYTVNVVNAAGAQGAYSGITSVVMDAVADQAKDLNGTTDYEDNGHTAVAPDAAITVSGQVTLADFDPADASEHHYLALNIPVGWAGALEGSLLSLDAVNGVFKGIGSDKLPDYPGAAGPEGRYLLLEVSPDGGFSLLDADGKSIPAPAGLSVNGPDADGLVTYSLPLQAPASGSGLYDAETNAAHGDLYAHAVSVESDPMARGGADETPGEYDYANNIAWTGLTGSGDSGDGGDQPPSDPPGIPLDAVEIVSTLDITTNVVYEGDNKDKVWFDPQLEGGGIITLKQVPDAAHPGAAFKSEAVDKVVFRYAEADGDPAEGTLSLGGVNIPTGGGLQFQTEVIDGQVRYVGATVVGADGVSKIGQLLSDEPQSFDDFMAGQGLKYTPQEGSYSDQDIRIDLVTVIQDKASGITRVTSTDPGWDSDPGGLTGLARTIYDDAHAPDSGFTYASPEGMTSGGNAVGGDGVGVVVDAVGDPAKVSGADVNYVNEDGSSRMVNDAPATAARPGGLVVLEGDVTFADLDESEDHTILVWNEHSAKSGVITSIKVIDNSTGEQMIYDVSDLNNLHPNVSCDERGQFTIKGIDNTVGLTGEGNDQPGFHVEVTLRTPADAAGNYSTEIRIGGGVRETGFGADAPGGEEAWLANNGIDVTQAIYYNVAEASGQVRFEAGSAFEGANANQHGGTHVDPALAKAFSISLVDGDGEYIAGLHMQFDTAGQGTMEYETAGGVVIELTSPVTLHFDAGGNCTDAEFTGVTAQGLAGGSLRYVPNSGSDEDANISVNWAASVVDRASGDTAVSTNMDGWSNTSDLAGNLLNNTPEADAPDAVAVTGPAAGSAGTIVVDAVADRPDVDTTGKVVYTLKDDDEVVTHDTGAPGGQVSVPLKLVFYDYQDGSENHNLTIGWTSALTGGTFANGKPVTPAPVLLENAIDAAVDGARLAGPGTYTYTDENTGLKFSIEVAADGTLSRGVTVEGTLMFNIVSNPKLEANGTHLAQVRVTGTAEEISFGAGDTGNDAGEELSIDNNTVSRDGWVNVNINAATSSLTVKLTNSRVYENAQPEAYQGDDAVQGYQYGGNSDWAYISGNTLADDPSTAKYENVRHYGAEIEVSGMKTGETADITFTLAGKGGAALDADVTNWGCLTKADGTVIGYFTKDDASGNWTCTVDDFASTTGKIYFVPGENYSSDDLTLGWSATVTDASSGHSKDLTGKTPSSSGLNVVVDAVAQAAVDHEGNVGLDVATYNLDNNVSEYVTQNFDVEVSATFRDHDGSESHYFLIQQSDSTGLSQEFLDYLASRNIKLDTHVNPDGNNQGVYYKIPLEALAGSTYVTMDGEGHAVLKVGMTTTLGDGGQVTLKTGAMSVETAIDSEHGLYSDTSGFTVGEDLSKTNSNNISIVWDGEISAEVALATASATAETGRTYEDSGHDQAHVGDNHQVYAQLKLAISTSDTVVDGETNGVTINYNPHMGAVYKLNDDGSYTRYDDRFDNCNDGQLRVSQELAESGRLYFLPKPGDINAGYTDRDTIVEYSFKVEDERSGHTIEVTQNQTVIIDAVAQRPGEGLGHTDQQGIQEGDSFSELMVVPFKDWDTATGHFVLVEAPGGWSLSLPEYPDAGITKVIGPDGKEYFAIEIDQTKMADAIITDTATANEKQVALRVILTAPDEFISDGYAPGLDGNMPKALHYGGMSVDRADLLSSGGENTWHNNTAFNVDQDITLNYADDGVGGPDPFEVGPAFENGTPNAHIGDEDTITGGTLYVNKDSFDIPADGGGRLEFSGMPDGSRIGYMEDGTFVGLATAADGTCSVDWDGSRQLVYMTPENDDTDFTLTLTCNGKSHSEKVVVDAVAQRADVTDIDVAYAPGMEAAKPAGAITVEVDLTLYDNASTAHYVLVERLPEWDAQGDFTTVYIDGRTYFQFPIADENQSTVSVSLIPPAAKGTPADEDDTEHKGMYSHGPLDVAVMSKENPTDGELSSANNTAIAGGDPVTVWISPVEVSARISATPYMYENRGETESDAGPQVNELTLNVAGKAWDVADSVTLTFGTAGKVVLTDPVTGADQTFTVGDNGTLTLTPDAYPDLFKELQDSGDGDGFSQDIKLTWQPDAYDSRDMSVSVKVEAHDSKSGDAKIPTAGASVGVDGVAWAPEDVTGQAVLPDGALKPGDGFEFKVTATFENVENQQEYMLIESKADWTYGNEAGPFDKIYNGGVEYLKIPVGGLIDQMLSSGQTEFSVAGVMYTITETRTDAGKDAFAVSMVLPVTSPDRAPAHDGTVNFNYGAMTEDHTDASINKNILNDYAHSIVGGSSSIPVNLGVVEATGLTISGAGVEDGYAVLSLDKLDSVDGTETLLSVTVTKAPVGGTLYENIDGEWQPVSGSNPTLDGARLAAGMYAFKLTAEDAHANVTMQYSAVVEDVSGHTKTFPGSAAISVKAVADAGVVDAIADIEATQNMVQPGHTAEVNVTLEASFGDNTDKSETHYFLVRVADGASVKGGIPADAADLAGSGLDGTVYKVALSGTAAEQDITLVLKSGYTDDSSFTVVAVSKESSSGSIAFSEPEGFNVSTDDLVYNRAPVAAGDNAIAETFDLRDAAVVFDDGKSLFTGITDADGNSELRISVGGQEVTAATVISGTHGELTVNPDGTYSYHLTADPAALGDTPAETFTYSVSDGYGNSEAIPMTLTIDLLPAAPDPVVVDSVTVVDPDTAVDPLMAIDPDAAIDPDTIAGPDTVADPDTAVDPDAGMEFAAAVGPVPIEFNEEAHVGLSGQENEGQYQALSALSGSPVVTNSAEAMAGLGVEIFAEDLQENMADHILNFSLSEGDKMQLNGVEATGLAFNGGNSVTVTLSNETETQMVDVTFQNNDTAFQSHMADYNASNGDEDAQAAALKALLTSMTG